VIKTETRLSLSVSDSMLERLSFLSLLVDYWLCCLFITWARGYSQCHVKFDIYSFSCW